MRIVLVTLSLAALVAALPAAAAPHALAQNAGIEQYLENPGGGSDGGGDGLGEGTQQAPDDPSGGSGSAGGESSLDAQGAASGTGTDASGVAGGSDNAKSGKHNNEDNAAASDKVKDAGNDPGVAQTQGSPVEDTGSGGMGVVLPIVLGALLLGAGVMAVMRRRRRAQSGHA